MRTPTRTPNTHLRVRYTDADRVRLRLRSGDTQTLNTHDVHTLLTILDDVYPVKKRKPRSGWLPVFIGIGIGFLVAVSVALLIG